MANAELTKKVYVKQLKNRFKFEQLTGDESSLERWVIAPDVNRPGLELTGYLETNDLKRVSILGNKEHDYLSCFDYDSQCQKFEAITDSYTPCIILSCDFEIMQSLLDVANRKNFPVFKADVKTYTLIVEVVSYLSAKLAPITNLYGTMLSIYGTGVMITGKSGIGKSELALDLIKRGHVLVADDRVDAKRIHNDVVCSAPKLLRKMLEIRGIGIVDVTKLFGIQSYLDDCQLDFIIEIQRYEDTMDNDRLNPISKYVDVNGIQIPQITIPVTEGKSLSVIIEAAVCNYLLTKQGINSNEEFKQRYNEFLLNRDVEDED